MTDDSPVAILHNTSGTEIGTAANPIRNDPTGTTTQPVSGTVTANIGTSGSLALDATLTGGTQKAITRGGAKGATTAADVTSTAEGADHQALDVQVYHGGAAVNPTAIRALTATDVVTSAQGTAAALAGAWPVKVTDGTNAMPTMDTAGRSGFERITDGTNTAAVKAASTAAVASDPALVVAISPNNTPVLPSGAATSALQGTGNTSLGNIDTKTPALGQAAMAGSQPVVIANNQTAVPISASALPLPSGAATETSLAAQSIVDNATFTDGTTRIVPAGFVFDETAGTALTENDGGAARIDSKRAQVFVQEDATTRGQRQSVNASGAALVKEQRGASAAVTSVAAAVADTSLLAVNTARMGAAVYNDSTAVLYLKLGTGASTTSFTARLVPNAYYEVPFNYTGAVNGYWSSATGNARITEVS
jgi:hypothetical protein